MKDKILLLCKRLDKFDIDKIETISEMEQAELLPILDELIEKHKLKLNAGVYYYIKPIYQVQKQKLPQFFQYHNKETISLIMKCFCAEIPVLKVTLIIEPSKTSIGNFYNYFRKSLYERQLKKLKQYYEKNPKIPSIRTLYDKKIYFYNYNNEIFLTDVPLKSLNPEKRHLKEEMRNMNVAYYRIRRVFQNYAFTKQLAEIAYEKLWMQDKEQEQKIFELSKLLNIS